MVHMSNPPSSIRLLAKCSAARQSNLLSAFDFQVVFHPNCVTQRMMGSRSYGKLYRRTLLKILRAVILHGRFAPIIVSSYGEDHHLRIKAFGKSAFIGVIEVLLAG